MKRKGIEIPRGTAIQLCFYQSDPMVSTLPLQTRIIKQKQEPPDEPRMQTNVNTPTRVTEHLLGDLTVGFFSLRTPDECEHHHMVTGDLV